MGEMSCFEMLSSSSGKLFGISWKADGCQQFVGR